MQNHQVIWNAKIGAFLGGVLGRLGLDASDIPHTIGGKGWGTGWLLDWMDGHMFVGRVGRYAGARHSWVVPSLLNKSWRELDD